MPRRDRSKSRGKRKSRSPSQKRESRKKKSPDARERSRGRDKKRGGSRSRSRADRDKKRGAKKQRSSSGSASADRKGTGKRSSPSRSKGGAAPPGPAAGKGKGKVIPPPRSPSRDASRSSPRRSPSFRAPGREDRGDAMEAGLGSAPGQEIVADEIRKPVKQGQVVTVSFSDRPFGMGPSKDAGVTGYVVAKVAEEKPAAQRGVQPGWRIVALDGKDCKDLDMDAIQKALKDAALPVSVSFEKPPASDSEPEDEDSDQEMIFTDDRAEFRQNHADLETLDEMPVKREPEEGMPEPIKSWAEAVEKGILNKLLLDKLKANGLKKPTPIQRHAIPIIGHKNGYYDLIALAQTGSGKTFAFVIPTVARMVIQGAAPRPFFPGKSAAGPLLLVLSPTRELAMQTSKEIEVLIKGTPLLMICMYGGESLKFQQQRIEKEQIDILCATPGRLVDMIDTGKISLSFVQNVVLDEADQMLENSLEVMVAEILTGRDMPTPSSGLRQTLLFSATMPPKIQELCPKITRVEAHIARLTIGNYGSDHGGSCSSIKQILKWVPDESQRMHMLVQDLRYYWLNTGKKGRVVIFTNQRLQANMMAGYLQSQGISCVHLHGKLDQTMREEVFNTFRQGKADILVATNVASRGLDFPDISFVVQFNLPNSIDIYTHRIGRTGRVGQVGAALSYMGPKDRLLTGKLIEFLQLNNQEVPDFLMNRHGGGFGGGGGRSGGGGYRANRRSRSRGRRW